MEQADLSSKNCKLYYMIDDGFIYYNIMNDFSYGDQVCANSSNEFMWGLIQTDEYINEWFIQWTDGVY